MAVTVTELRTIWSDCNTANWTLGQPDTLYTSSPAPKELTGCLGFVASEDNIYAAYINTTQNLSAGVLVYAWILTQGTIENTQSGGVQILLGDGTDRIGFHIAGSDKSGFRHDIGGVNWQCHVMDTSNLPTYYTEHAGTLASLDLSSIVNVGIGAYVSSKSLGGTENVFADVIFIGNQGIRITGGGSGTEGNFSELATKDASDTDSDSSFGICREVTAGVFGLQGPLTFGDSASTGSLDFYATNEIVSFEDRDLGTDKYFIIITGNSTGTTSFQLGTQLGATYAGSDGCTISCPIGVGAYFDASNANVEYVLLYGNTFYGFNNGVDFSADATNGPNHEIYGNTFSACGQIDPGKTLFKGNSIKSSTDSATGALLLDSDGTSSWQDLSFTSGGTGHAIYITATGSYTFTNFEYSGYGSDGTTDAVVYNNSGGLVTITVSGGDSPTVRNGSGATTNIINTKTITITVKNENNVAVQGAQVYVQKSASETGEYGHPTNPYTSHATNNSAGDSTFEITQTIESDNPVSGWINVRKLSTSPSTEQTYRYASKSGSIFTLRSEVTGTDNGTGTATTINETGIGAKDIVEGDTIRNTTDTQWAIVLSVSANSVTTTKLSGGASWASDNYSVHRLALDYSTGDIATVPIMNKETDASGIASENYNLGATMAVDIRIRKSTEAVKYFPYKTTASISDNLAVTAVLIEDTIIG